MLVSLHNRRPKLGFPVSRDSLSTTLHQPISPCHMYLHIQYRTFVVNSLLISHPSASIKLLGESSANCNSGHIPKWHKVRSASHSDQFNGMYYSLSKKSTIRYVKRPQWISFLVRNIVSIEIINSYESLRLEKYITFGSILKLGTAIIIKR